ncbi:transglutaminase domain-containing protein [Candidatus Woesearchaeota archaeon]|nr:transglutaminase domain-containing protein [Candidatus Woesearchaeota archaeon]
MKHQIVLAFLFMLPLTIAEQIDNYNDYGSLTLRFIINNTIEAIAEEDAELDYLSIELLLFPKETAIQKVISQKVSSAPPAEIKEQDPILFTWDSYNYQYQFNLDSTLQTRNIIYKLQPEPFPLTNVPPEIKQYTEATDFIDINQDIINKASELVEGKTDLSEAVFAIADWTKSNIKYDLNTLTAQAVKKSSWVFENKEGVCDELTNLFISLLRSVGIPARFVTGMVYTNVDYSFGNHGWAEVYFPEQGWVPFDITFGQYGYLDPSHIKLMDDYDSGTPSSKYSWRASDLEIIPKDLLLSAKVITKGEKIQSPFTLSLEPSQRQVGPASYVPLEVTIKNPYDSYVSTVLTITKAPDLTESNVKQVLLKPKQEKTIFWTAKINPDLDPNLIYTSYLEVKDFFGNTADATLEYADSYDTIPEQEAESIISSFNEKEGEIYSRNLYLKCQSVKAYYYSYESTAEILCSLENVGNTLLRKINICIENSCKEEDLLLIGHEKEISFDLPLAGQKTKQLIITAKNDEVDVSAYAPLRIFSEPDVRITFLNPPEQLAYDEEYKLNFVINSQVTVKDINLQINRARYELKEFQGSQNVEAKIKAKAFISKPLKITMDYKDENGNTYTLEKTLPIEVIHIPWYGKIFGVITKFLP